MPQFNPDIKDINPVNPIGWSKSAEVPAQFASALSEGIKGIGNFIGQAAEAGDKLVKQSAQQAAENIFRPEVDDEAARLAGVDFSMKLNADTVAASDSTNGLQANATVSGLKEGGINMPPALQQLPKTLGVLDGARANGHLSETAYHGRLMSLAKDLRSQYPVGYREYIDAQISKVTGVDPANAYMKSIIGDINASAGNALAEKNKVLGRLLEHQGLDPVGIPKMYEALSNGRTSIRQAMDFLAPLEAEKVNHERAMMKVQEKEAGSKFQDSDAENAFRSFSSGRIATTLGGVIKTEGLTPDKINNIIQRHYNNEQVLTGGQILALNDRVKSLAASDRSAMINELNKVQPDPDKPNYRPVPLSAMLKDKGTKIIEEALYPYQKMSEDLAAKDTGMLFQSQRIVEAMKNDDALVYFKAPPEKGMSSFRQVAGYLNVLKQAGGDQAVAQGWARAVSHGLPDIQTQAIQSKIANLATAPDPRGPKFKEVNSLGEALDRTAAEVAKTGIPQPQTYKEIQNMIDGPKLSLLDPATKPEVKAAIANNFFGPENVDVLNKIKPDYRDEKGNLIPGQESWFKRFTQPEVVQQINRLDDTTKANYHGWVERTYESIAKQSIQNLKTMNIEGAYKVGWNSVTGQFTVSSNYNRPDRADDAIRGYGNVRSVLKIDPVQDTVTKLNKAISGLANSYIYGSKLSPEDVQAKVLETLHFDKQRFGKMEGLPAKFLQSMEIEYQKNEEERKAKIAKEADQKKKSTP